MRFTHFWAAAAVAFVPVTEAQATDWAPSDPEAFEVKLDFDSVGRYTAPIGMGKPWSQAGNFSFLLSTSSPYTAVASAECATCVAQMGQAPVYNMSSSSSAFTLPTTQQTFSIGNGNMAGGLILETCSLRKATTTKWSYDNQTVMKVESTAGILGAGVSGFVGFGRSTGNASYLSGIINSQGWENATFGFSFNTFSATVANDTAPRSAGSITVRELNPGLFTGEIFWQPLTQLTGIPTHTPSDWSIKFDSYKLKFGSQITTSSGGIAIIEPYFQEVRIPLGEATEFFDKIPGSVMTNDSLSLSWVVPCDQELTFSITIGGNTYLMKKEQLISLDSTGTVCTSLVKGWSDPAVNAYMLGTPFTSVAYIAYNAHRDQSSDQIGLAPRSTYTTTDYGDHGVSKTVLIAAIVASILGAGLIISVTLFVLYRRRRSSDTPGSHNGNPGDNDKLKIDPFTSGEPNSATPIYSTTKRQGDWVIEQGPVGGEPSSRRASELTTHEQVGSLNSPQSLGIQRAMRESQFTDVSAGSPTSEKMAMRTSQYTTMSAGSSEKKAMRESQYTTVSVGSPTPETSPHQDVQHVAQPSRSLIHSFYGAGVPSVLSSAPEPERQRRLSEPAPPPYVPELSGTNTQTTAEASTSVSPLHQKH